VKTKDQANPSRFLGNPGYSHASSSGRGACSVGVRGGGQSASCIDALLAFCPGFSKGKSAGAAAYACASLWEGVRGCVLCDVRVNAGNRHALEEK
jgi:hypothetical protein